MANSRKCGVVVGLSFVYGFVDFPMQFKNFDHIIDLLVEFLRCG